MPKFLRPLRVEQVGWSAGRPLWRLTAPLHYRSSRLGAVVRVPAGFKTDFASVPRLLFSWWIAGGRAPRAAVIHDFLYQGGLVADRRVSRSDADAVLQEAAAADPHSGTNAITRFLMWSAVRVAGWVSYRRRAVRAKSMNPRLNGGAHEAP